MRHFILIFCIGVCCVDCSSSDDNGETEFQEPTAIDHYSLILNGAGFTDQRVELSKDTITNAGPGVLFSASDALGNALGVVVPTSGEAETIIGEYTGNSTNIGGFEANTASFFIGNTIYRSENGIFAVTENEFADPCTFWRGNLDINFTVDGLGGSVLNVKGTFDIPSFNCE